MNSIKNSLNGQYPVVPVAKELNLKVAPGTVSVTSTDFTYIKRCIPILRFLTNSVDWAKIGNDTALANGIQMYYNGSPLGKLIKANYDLFDLGYDINIAKDDKNPKSNIITARWSFDKWTPNGLATWYGQQFAFVVGDNLTALTSILEFHIHVQGWKVAD